MFEKAIKIQGDVFFVKVDVIPETKKIVKPSKEGYIIAKGEITGHAHKIEDVVNVIVYQVDDVYYIECLEPVYVMHDEHKPITLDPGIWKVGIQREYDYMKEITKVVRD